MYTVDEMNDRPARITGDGKIFIGDEQILAEYPIEAGSISVRPWHGRLNLLTLTIACGPVSMEIRPRTPAEVAVRVADAEERLSKARAELANAQADLAASNV